MRTFFTSDHHFGHRNILHFEAANRPFDSIRVMDDFMIHTWNSIVSPQDVVYHLGDFALSSKKRRHEIAQQLHGYKIIIRGNHDASTQSLLDIGFNEVYDWMIMRLRRPYADQDMSLLLVHDAGKYVGKRGIENGFDFIVCGHVHSNWKRKWNAVNVSVDQWVFRPIELTTVLDGYPGLFAEDWSLTRELVPKPHGSASLALHGIIESRLDRKNELTAD